MDLTVFRKILHLLGDTLGEIICKHSGETTYKIIERIRTQSKFLRDQYNSTNFDTEFNKLDSYIAEIDSVLVQDVTRGFVLYLFLNNVAETVFQTINYHSTTESSNIEMSKFLKAKQTDSALSAQLENFTIQIVLTQHPTEVRRRTLLHKEQELFNLCLEYFEESKRTQSMIKADIEEIIETLWLTAETRDFKLSVDLEIQTVAAFANYSLFQVISRLMKEFWFEYREEAGKKLQQECYPMIKVGSWVGGDRDGNPYVTDEKTQFALIYNRKIAIDYFINQLDDLHDHCSISLKREKKILPRFEQELKKRIEQDSCLPDKIKLNISEPYRQWIGICKHRLKMSYIDENGSHPHYRIVDELKWDLRLLKESLKFIHAEKVASGLLQNLINELEVFGFHFAALDIRQHSDIFGQLIDEIYTLSGITDNYLLLNSAEKVNLLLKSLDSPRISIFAEELSSVARELWNLFSFIENWSKKFGSSSLGSIIISMTVDASDIFEVLTLQYWKGLFDPLRKRNPLPIVPLFETIESLENSNHIMDTVWSHDIFRSYMAQLNNRQEIMIGYSDSAKDGGYLASQWNIYTTQERLITLSDNYGIKLLFFHGRGGSVGRGGGEFITASEGLPKNALKYGIKITEQGEVIANKYLHPDIAYMNLSKLLLTVLRINSFPEQSKYPVTTNDRKLFSNLARVAKAHYQEFVYNSPNFVQFFTEASPFEFIDKLNIGSRPSKRRDSQSIHDLRAIPWIFAWTQNRTLLPVWFGIGTAFSKFREELPTLRKWYQEWKFFKGLIDNLSVQLLKADMNSAKRYSQLSELYSEFFPQIFQEYFETRRMIRLIINQKHLVVENPLTQKSLEARTPYLDALSLIQVHAIKRFRQFQRTTDSDIVLLTINGIAAGMKNTG